jgi:hypothetical protein
LIKEVLIREGVELIDENGGGLRLTARRKIPEMNRP